MEASLRNSFRFRGRSYLAFVLTPEAPTRSWFRELDVWLSRSPGFFLRKPIVIDVSRLSISKDEFATLVADLNARDIRILGAEGADPTWVGPGLPPLLSGGRTAGLVEDVADQPTPLRANVASRPSAAALLIAEPVRSGQSIVHPDGDVAIVGSVASGAEIVAGGSIHIYGILRGRALAGTNGNTSARIFCRQLDAELIAIDGYYKIADEFEPNMHKKPIQAWLESETLNVATLD
jgi:septum site-determining protein MinC